MTSSKLHTAPLTWLVWQFWTRQLKNFHAVRVIFPLLLLPCSTINTLKDPHANKHTTTAATAPIIQAPLPSSFPLFLVIKASAWPRWPQATCLFIWRRRRESCHIPFLHGGAASLSAVCVSHSFLSRCPHCLSPLYLMRSLPPPFSFLSPTLSLFLPTGPSRRGTKGGSAPDISCWDYLYPGCVELFLAVWLY